MEDYYDEIAPGYNDLRSKEQIEKALFVEHILPYEEDSTILDVGCGTGISMSVFKCFVTGLEPSSKMIEQNPFKDKVVQGFAEAIPFEDNSFDYVVSITAAQNFKNIQTAVSEIKRVAKKGCAITILSRSKKKDLLYKELSKLFNVIKQYKIGVDSVFLCFSNKS